MDLFVVGELHIVTVDGAEICIRIVRGGEVVALELNGREREQILLVARFAVAPGAICMA